MELETEFFDAIATLKSLTFIDSEAYFNEAIRNNKRILAEGAQGSLLDIDFGTYPFVTSSNTTAAGASTGLGVSPKSIGEVLGIFKAYTTRVGSGPFPTELFNATGKTMARVGHEFGATTGRPRRCGWLDLVALKYAVQINGVTQLMMMKGDVLSGFKTLKVCTAYKYKGEIITHLPYNIEAENIVVLDATIPKVAGSSLKNNSGYIPKSQFFDIKKTFSDIKARFPNTLPSVEQFQTEAQKLGINKDSLIIVYDQHGIYSSARAWWLFRYFGHEKEKNYLNTHHHVNTKFLTESVKCKRL